MRPREFVHDHSLGQHFLYDGEILGAIADHGADDCVLEIGAGEGTLTRRLVQRAQQVVSIELDQRLRPKLEALEAEFSNLHVVWGDVRKLDLQALCREYFGEKRASVCANLPYYITKNALKILLTCGVRWNKIVLLLQKEAALKAAARPGEDGYGALSVFLSYFGSRQVCLEVGKELFTPPPQVDSALFKLELFEKPAADLPAKQLFSVVDASFAQRRKTLVNALASSPLVESKEKALQLVQACGLYATVRAEELSIQEFARLAELIFQAT